MENQQVINMFLGLGITVVGWFARELWAAVKELKADLAKTARHNKTGGLAGFS